MTVFLRALGTDDKAELLQEMIDSYRSGQPHQDVYEANPASFKLIPNSSFAYWVGESIIALFEQLPPFESEDRTVKQGLATADDFRFVRAWWEVPATKILNAQHAPVSVQDDAFQSWCQERTQQKTWVTFAKGGEFSPYYSDIHLVVNWGSQGKEMKAWADPLYNHSGWSRIIKSVDFYFLPGLTYPRRLHKMAIMPLPGGAIISVRGSGIYGYYDHLALIAGLFSSSCFDFLVKMMLGRTGYPQFDNGTLCRTPVPQKIFQTHNNDLSSNASKSIAIKRNLDTANDLSHVFHLPALLQVTGVGLSDRVAAWNQKVVETKHQLIEHQQQIDDIVFHLYGISEIDRKTIKAHTQQESPQNEENGDDEIIVDLTKLLLSVLQYAFGCAFGRWDIRYATGEKQLPELPDPFAPLPVCPPGMLQNAEGLPAEPQDVPNDYPLRITWNGILVDDEGHPEDIVARVREALEVIWHEKAGDIEQEAGDILGVKTLRDYFGNPNKFFADHLKRYSKSRRQAPIYWPLSTASGSYTLWLYYHRLTDQTLYTCVNDYVEPKLKHVADTLADLRRKPDRSRQDEKTLEQLLDLERELHDFRDELLRIAAFWKPNLNDGVQITAAPLWKLFKLSKWQKTLKDTWKKLEKGDYDWAQLAYSIWPERVVRASRKDRSYAIAHDLEDALWEEVEITGKRGKPKTTWQPKKLTEAELQQIIQEKKRV